MSDDKGTETRETFTEEIKRSVSSSGPATARAEQEVKLTGKLHPLVDPAGYGLIRRSLPRFVECNNGLWRMAVGMPIPKEDRIDTTGSMGGNVDVAISVLPDSYGLCSMVLPGCDLQMATGIFGDVQDPIVLCRPQFEMSAGKIVEQLTLQVPCRDGGDTTEDPHYGLFGAAYLTASYAARIGLKGYDFTVSDAPARDRLDEQQLKRIFGKEVFKKVKENGHNINRNDLPSTKEIVHDLLRISHAFFLQVGNHNETTRFWIDIYGRDRVVYLPRTELLPYVQAAIIGLTEGVLGLSDVEDFLRQNNAGNRTAKEIVRSVAGIPIGAQAALPNFSRRPKAGDIFRNKTDLWPMSEEELEKINIAIISKDEEDDVESDWL